MGDMDKFHGLVVFVAARSLLGVFSVDGEDGRKTAPADRRSIVLYLQTSATSAGAKC